MKSQSFDQREYDQIFLILDTAEKTVKLIKDNYSKSKKPAKNSLYTLKDNCFWECMANEGRNIGRGIVAGAIGGAIWGASTGASGGSVVLPGIGTATGAVGGAVFGATSGAISGAIAAALWSAADCAILCGGSPQENLPQFEPQCFELQINENSLQTQTVCK